MRCSQSSPVQSSSSNNGQHLGENSIVQSNHLPQGTLLPSGVPGGQLIIPTGAVIEAGSGTLSRHPQMGTKTKRLAYGIEGMPETGTLRGQIMPMGAQTSPMSSTGSTQLIYNGGSNARHLQEWAYQHPDAPVNKNAFDERLLYYDTNARSLKQSRSRDDELQNDTLEQHPEVFHWTEGRNKKHRKRGNHPNNITGSNRNIYPSYRNKHPHNNLDPEAQDLQEQENSYLQNYRRYMQAEADAEFLAQYQRQLPYNQAYPNALSNNRQHLTSQQIAAQRYYQQHANNYMEEPVYEEIVGSHMSSTYGGGLGPPNGLSDDDEMDVESDDERFQNGTDEEDSGSRSNKDDLSSRQSSR